MPGTPPAVTISGLVAQVANRLSTGGTSAFWSTDELTRCVQEAFRTWNAFALYYRDRFPLTTVANTAVYDLSQANQAKFGYDVSNNDLFQMVQCALLEPPNTNQASWIGTPMFSWTDLLNAYENKGNQFALESKAVLLEITVAVPAGSSPDGRVVLDSGVLAVHRAEWIDTASGIHSRVWRNDEIEMNAFAPGWQFVAGTPLVYSEVVASPMTLQLAPIPAAAGTLDLLVIGVIEEGGGLPPIILF